MCEAALDAAKSSSIWRRGPQSLALPLAALPLAASEGIGGPRPAHTAQGWPLGSWGRTESQGWLWFEFPLSALVSLCCSCPCEWSGDFEGLCPSSLRIPSRSFGIHSWDLLQIDSHTTESYKHGEPAGKVTDIPVSTIFCKLYVP